MKVEKNRSSKKKESKEKSFKEAEKSYRQLQKEIEPYIRQKKFRKISTIGKWQLTSSLNS